MKSWRNDVVAIIMPQSLPVGMRRRRGSLTVPHDNVWVRSQCCIQNNLSCVVSACRPSQVLSIRHTLPLAAPDIVGNHQPSRGSTKTQPRAHGTAFRVPLHVCNRRGVYWVLRVGSPSRSSASADAGHVACIARDKAKCMTPIETVLEFKKRLANRVEE